MIDCFAQLEGQLDRIRNESLDREISVMIFERSALQKRQIHQFLQPLRGTYTGIRIPNFPATYL
jgi:hypothetical protein